MNKQRMLSGMLIVVVLLALAGGFSQAQGPQPGDATGVTGDEPGGVGAYIPVQGRLTDASGNPLDGTISSVILRIYQTGSGGTALCTRSGSLSVSNGLFSTYIPCSSSAIDGRQLYLGVQVGSDAEMTDRQAIYPVPYAFSLKPGARISDTMSGTPLEVYNHGTGWGLDVYSAGHDAVHGRTGSSDHAGVAGVSWGSGIGVYGESKDNYGVVGKHLGTNDYAGVYGRSDSPSGYGGRFVNWSAVHCWQGDSGCPR